MNRFDPEIWVCDIQSSIVMMGGGSSGSAPSDTTTTQTTELPAYEQGFSQQIQGQAAAIASQAYPTYQGEQIAPMNQLQANAIGQLSGSDPNLNAYGGQQAIINAQNMSQTAGQLTTAALDPNAVQNNIGNFMSPYVQQSLAPQMLAAQTQLGQQQQQTDAQATQAGAFGDARQGVQASLNNYYGDQTMAGIQAQGLNTAYSSALQAAQNQQSAQLQGATNLSNQGTQLSSEGAAQQQQNLNAASALYGAGSAEQQQNQSADSQAYANFWNQVNWPMEMQNVEESAITNSPYSTTRLTTLPQTSTTAQNIGAFGALAGGVGSLANGSGASGNNAASMFR